MSTAADYDPYHDDNYHPCPHELDCRCGDGPSPATDPALAELLDGPAADALDGLGIIRDLPPTDVPAAVMVQAVLAAQRLGSWARAQQHRWTAALARPGVAVPITDLLDSLGHRGDEPGPGGAVPDDVVERAAAGHA